VVEALTYDDVLLVPQYSDIESRSEIELGTDMGHGVRLALPIISSPMDTITETLMVQAMDTQGGLGIVHRYNGIDEQTRLVYKASTRDVKNIGAAIGVTGDYAYRAESLVDHGANIICVDVAHGQHSLVERALKILREKFPDLHIMAGNVATRQGFDMLASWGASSVRCNIGGGSICTTRIQTGHGIPGLHTIMDCANSEYAGDVKIVADGGIKNSGDIVKALAAGADAVMLGSLLSGTTETPGEVVHLPRGKTMKVYRGMASKDAQNDWRGKTSSVEGVTSTVPFRGPVRIVLNDLEAGLRSGLSYSGARNITQLHDRAVFVRQTHAGLIESGAHINRG